ncbi:SDR family NAD(P)-dependent oxidoreductase [Geochorda subterranea]|uniref:SDR family NAD(P)-dependent oxidoreductase n=1 Tax=Geochorda subterranea TaxID=3109564 RepID=A0ABZ1BSQ3_9FIRM|nr:SDR family NAD(P)-dependent oxidoreductase [Limnochorda sp. LNt]WRP15812.1 SDR family NAD(P)-dependent oxidoreductase [Limnochorda sp. LNt]
MHAVRVAGAVALVTGGASGLGEAAVRRLHRLGARVVVADVAVARGQSLAAELGEGARFVEVDVTDEAAVSRSVQAAVGLGPLRILVNAAGIGVARRILGREGPMPLDEFARVIQVNLVGTFNALRLAAAAMAEAPPDEEGERGVIVNTASVAAFEGQIGQAAYAASKGGVVGLTLPAARELARFGIRVVTIAPGVFDTPMVGALPEPVRTSLEAQVPFPPRLGRPDEYAALVQHIVENPMLNGAVIRLDGALRMASR